MNNSHSERNFTLDEVEDIIQAKRNYRLQLLQQMKAGDSEAQSQFVVNNYQISLLKAPDYFDHARTEAKAEFERRMAARTHTSQPHDFEFDPDISNRISETRMKAQNMVNTLREQISETNELLREKPRRSKKRKVARERNASLDSYVKTYTQHDRLQMKLLFQEIDFDDTGVVSLFELKSKLNERENFCELFGIKFEDIEFSLDKVSLRRKGLVHFDEFIEAMNAAMEKSNLDGMVTRTVNGEFSTPNNNHIINERDIKIFREIFAELDHHADGIVLAVDFLQTVQHHRAVGNILDKQLKPDFTLSDLIRFFEKSLLKSSNKKQYLTWSGFIDMLWRASKEETTEDVAEILKLNDNYWLIGEEIALPPSNLRLLQDIFDSLPREMNDTVLAANFVNSCKKDPQIKVIKGEKARNEGNGLPEETIEDILNRIFIESEPTINWKDVLMFFSARGRPLSFLRSNKLMVDKSFRMRNTEFSKTTKPTPFSFTSRPKSHSIREQWVSDLVKEKEYEEERELRTRIKPKKIPKSVLVPQLDKIKKEQNERRQKSIEESKNALLSSIKEFNFQNSKHKPPQPNPEPQHFRANPFPKTNNPGLYKKLLDESEAQRKERIEKRKEEVKNSVKMPPRMEKAEKEKKQKEQIETSKKETQKNSQKKNAKRPESQKKSKKEISELKERKKIESSLLNEVKSVEVAIVPKKKLSTLNASPTDYQTEKLKPKEETSVQDSEKKEKGKEEKSIVKEKRIDPKNSNNEKGKPPKEQISNKTEYPKEFPKDNQKEAEKPEKKKRMKIIPQEDSLQKPSQIEIIIKREFTPPKPPSKNEILQKEKVKDLHFESKKRENEYKAEIAKINEKVRETKHLYMEERYGSKLLKKYRQFKEEEVVEPTKLEEKIDQSNKEPTSTLKEQKASKKPFIKTLASFIPKTLKRKASKSFIEEFDRIFTLTDDQDWKDDFSFGKWQTFLTNFSISSVNFPIKSSKLVSIYGCLAAAPDLLKSIFSIFLDGKYQTEQYVFKHLKSGATKFSRLPNRVLVKKNTDKNESGEEQISETPLFVTSFSDDFWPLQLHKALILFTKDFHFHENPIFDCEYIFDGFFGAPSRFVAISENLDGLKFFEEISESLENGYFVIFQRFYKGTANLIRLADCFQIESDFIFKLEDPLSILQIPNLKYRNIQEWSANMMSIISPSLNDCCLYLTIDEIIKYMSEVQIIEVERNFVVSSAELDVTPHKCNFLNFHLKNDQKCVIKINQTINSAYKPLDFQLFKLNDVDPWILVSNGSNRKYTGHHTIYASTDHTFLNLPAGEYAVRIKAYDPISSINSSEEPAISFSIYSAECIMFTEYPKTSGKAKYSEFLILRAKKNLKKIDKGLYMGYEEFDSRFILYLENRSVQHQILANFTLENPQNVKIGKENKKDNKTIHMKLRKESAFGVIKQDKRNSNTGFQLKTDYKIEKLK